MWKLLKAVGKGIFYVVFSPIFLFLWVMDRAINGKPGGQDKILGQQLPPEVKYFSSSGTFSVVDVGAYFGSIAAPRRENLLRASKKMEEEEKRIAVERRMQVERDKRHKKGPMSGIKVSAGSATFSIEDPGEYFSYIPGNKPDDPS